MKKVAIQFLVLALGASICFTACRRKKDDVTEAAEQATQSNDQSMFNDASNEVLDAVNDGLESKSAARTEGTITVANADVTLSSNNDTLYINFHGDNASGTRTRTGKAIAYLNSSARWYTKGASWTVDFTSGVTVTRKSDGASATITGKKTITNVTGGHIYALTAGDSVQHQVAGNMQLLFNGDNTQRSWTISRTRTFYKDGSYYRMTLSGYGSDGTYSHIAEQGTNRFGNQFTTTIDPATALDFRYCTSSGRYKIFSGTVSHHRTYRDFSVTYGLNSAGVQASTVCAVSGFKVDYTTASGEAKSKTFFVY